MTETRITVPIEAVGYWSWSESTFMFYDCIRDWLIERLGETNKYAPIEAGSQWWVSSYDKNPATIDFVILDEMVAVEFKLTWA